MYLEKYALCLFTGFLYKVLVSSKKGPRDINFNQIYGGLATCSLQRELTCSTPVNANVLYFP